MVISVPGGPSPKNSGSVVEITSASSTLSKVTTSVEDGVVSSGTLKPDDFVASSGIPTEASGRPDSLLGGRFLKS